MRKDMLLKDWCRKARYSDDYKIEVGAMLVYDGDDRVLECFADLYIDGELEVTETIDLIENADYIEKMPTSMKRKAKAFVQYFKENSPLFHDVISFNDKIIVV